MGFISGSSSYLLKSWVDVITKKHNTANDNFGTVINAEVDLLGKQHAWDVSEVIASIYGIH
jgi:hypothetical protein